MTSHAKSRGRENWRQTLSLLDHVASGLLVFELNPKYRNAFVTDGLAGVRRLVEGEERRRLMRRLRDLKRRGFLEERKKGKAMLLGLTGKGSAYRLKFQVRSAPRLPSGWHWLLTFDIPERQKHLRDRLRTYLKSVGFKMVHQSVWLTDRDVISFVAQVFRESGTTRWLKWYRVQEE